MQLSGKNLHLDYDSILVSKKNEVYLQLTAESSVLREASEYFTFMVPGCQFTPAYRNKIWDGKIRLLNLNNGLLYYGLLKHLEKFCDSRQYQLIRDDSVTKKSNITAEQVSLAAKNLNLPFNPYDYQIDAVREALSNKRLLLLSPTGSGKSLIIYLLTRFLNKKTLIIVPTTSLVTQMRSDFIDYSQKNGWNVDDNVHVIFQGQDKVSDKQIIISTWQSIYKMPKQYYKDFGLVIGDEAHGFKSKSLTDIMTRMENTPFRIGTTGTLDGTKTHKLVLEGLFGHVYKVITTDKLIKNDVLSQFKIESLVLEYPDEIKKNAKKLTYQQEIEFLVTYFPRNNYIKNLALGLKGNTLVLYQLVEKHGKVLHELIEREAKNRKVFFVHGGVDTKIREEIRHITEKESNAIIVASYGTFSTGINIRNLHNIIFASPSKSRIRNLQSIGRGLRKSDRKDIAVLYDIADDLTWKSHVNYTLNHFKLRIQMYGEEKFPYKIHNINL